MARMAKQGDYNKKGNADKTLDEALDAKVTVNGETNSQDDAVAALAGHLNKTADDDDVLG
ncbi:hypothetical protein SD70_04375 [Gordoniibacillus kamchatkensis]|uniref:DUF4025 domain-containing protein n=1 Tax=Gordoniibacillus kamchatkensis TaxID=1590651 RepID=A0ABR5ALQ3_9BACL|nr:hypothetical protein [Paenibacillus sp. VKM B-2647]KIL41857.1 hypothetical protein SD70_04375 [Paenibacillus sp. VKM B-2647]